MATFESLKPELQLLLERIKYTFDNKPWSKELHDLWEQDVAVAAQQLCDSDKEYADFALVGINYLFPFAKFADGAMVGAPGVDAEIAAIMGRTCVKENKSTEERKDSDSSVITGAGSGHEAGGGEASGSVGVEQGIEKVIGQGALDAKGMANERGTAEDKNTPNDKESTPVNTVRSASK